MSEVAETGPSKLQAGLVPRYFEITCLEVVAKPSALEEYLLQYSVPHLSEGSDVEGL